MSRPRLPGDVTPTSLRVRVGRRDLPPFEARPPRGGWHLEALQAACLAYAEQHAAEGLSLRGLAQSAWTSVASPALRSQEMRTRIAGRDWLDLPPF